MFDKGFKGALGSWLNGAMQISHDVGMPRNVSDAVVSFALDLGCEAICVEGEAPGAILGWKIVPGAYGVAATECALSGRFSYLHVTRLYDGTILVEPMGMKIAREAAVFV
mgnify:CR=1 FL=1